jgi:tripartite ATP-independent transporter DctM subunit
VSGPALGVAAFVAMLGLLALRMPVAIAMFVCGSTGYVLIAGLAPYLAYLKTTPYYLFANYTLSVIPFFVLMGCLAERGGLSQAAFGAAHALVGHRRGGLAMAVIGGCTLFGAICGSSVATTAAMGRAALPELRRYGYDGRLATGTLAVGGTLGILVPPSLILVVYALSTEQNIAKLFMAAFVPGLLASVFYLLAIAWTVRRHPEAGPAGRPMSGAERRRALMQAGPVLVVVLVVIGGIYGGVFTPTEGAAVGVVATLLVGLARRSLGARAILESLTQTAEITAMIFLILLGAEVFNGFLGLSELPVRAAETIASAGLSPHAVLLALLGLYVLLGGVMDELAMILLTLPVFFPVVMALDFGLGPEQTALWFGIQVLIIVGIGLTAPPIGLNVFVINALSKDVPITTTYRGVLPFLATDFVRLALVILFPGLALGLVRLLG